MIVLARHYGVCHAVSRPIRLLGHSDEDLCICLCVCGTPADHQRVLYPDGAPSEERTSAVRLTGEGPQSAPHHSSRPGGGGRICHLLDAHSYLHPGQSPVP